VAKSQKTLTIYVKELFLNMLKFVDMFESYLYSVRVSATWKLFRVVAGAGIAQAGEHSPA